MNIKDIKTKIKNIWNAPEQVVSMRFPRNKEENSNPYKKCWVSLLTIELSDFDSFCEKNKDNEILICKVLKSFHEGLFEIFQNAGIENVSYHGDKVYAYAKADGQNSKESKKLFTCAMDINGFLKYFWKAMEYKISICLAEELVLNVDSKYKLSFAGYLIKKAKKMHANSKIKNQILLDKLFVINNKEVLKKSETENFYTESLGGELYSTYCCTDWKDE
ncbi:MAG: hypothetical protein K2K73_01545 [Ureaplasma sp.]|nr:hypothetical protein [Ureaplasma sp.]